MNGNFPDAGTIRQAVQQALQDAQQAAQKAEATPQHQARAYYARKLKIPTGMLPGQNNQAGAIEAAFIAAFEGRL